LLSAKALRTGFWSVFDVEIGGKPGDGLCRHLLTAIGVGAGFSQLQLQQQEVLFFVLMRFKKTIYPLL